jgi:hypothetical protein
MDKRALSEVEKAHVWQELHNLAYLMNNEQRCNRQRMLQTTLAKFSNFDLSNEWELSIVRDLLYSWAEDPREAALEEAEYQRGFVGGSWFADNTASKYQEFLPIIRSRSKSKCQRYQLCRPVGFSCAQAGGPDRPAIQFHLI